MSEFKPIETQEAFDEAIKERIERAKNSVRSEFSDYESLKVKAAEYDAKKGEFAKLAAEKDASIADLQKKLAAHETDSEKRKLAEKYSLPAGATKFLTGKDAAEWEASAKELAELAKPHTQGYPNRNSAEHADNGHKTMAARMAENLHAND